MSDNPEPTTSDLLVEIRSLREDLVNEVKRWDERFFQLTRDSLNFTRTVVTTAAVVAVLVPALKDVLPAFIELFVSRSPG